MQTNVIIIANLWFDRHSLAADRSIWLLGSESGPLPKAIEWASCAALGAAFHVAPGLAIQNPCSRCIRTVSLGHPGDRVHQSKLNHYRREQTDADQ